MRCAVVLLVLLLSLSALSASTAEANEERLLRDNAIPLTGRKWLRGRKAMAAAGPGHGDVVVKEGKNTGANTAHAHGSERTVEVTVVGLSGEGAANQEADSSAKSVNHEEKQSKGRAAAATHVMFQDPTKHDNTISVVSKMMSLDYKTLEARHHRPINNDAPLDHELVEKP
uniref:BURP domain-containing protein n=1 Tax=Leersia perrieri TaxID=77586 RepID=A0A0D9XES9_9ORYZ